MKFTKIFIFLGGLSLGFGAGVIVTKKRLTDQFNADLDREINDIRVYFNEKYAENAQNDGNLTQKTDGEGQPISTAKNERKSRKELTESDYFGPKKSEKKTNYTSFFDDSGVELPNSIHLDPGGPQDDPPEEYDEDLDDEEGENLPDLRDETEKIAVFSAKIGIEIISSDDYTDRNGYDKEELFYYRKSEVITDENDELLDGFSDILGHEWLDIIEQSHAKVVYVRNNGFSKDYLITVLNERYNYDTI